MTADMPPVEPGHVMTREQYERIKEQKYQTTHNKGNPP